MKMYLWCMYLYMCLSKGASQKGATHTCLCLSRILGADLSNKPIILQEGYTWREEPQWMKQTEQVFSKKSWSLGASGGWGGEFSLKPGSHSGPASGGTVLLSSKHEPWYSQAPALNGTNIVPLMLVSRWSSYPSVWFVVWGILSPSQWHSITPL